MARRLVSLVPLFALAALSCSDPANVPPQGALYISVTGGGSCNVNTNYSLPSGTAAVTAIRDHGGEDPTTGEIYRVVDGDGADIACKVAVAGEGASVDVNLHLSKAKSLSFGAAGNIAASGGTIHIAEWDNQTGQPLEGDCAVQTRDVQKGAIYGTFSCPSFGDGELVECSATGAFVFENCDK